MYILTSKFSQNTLHISIYFKRNLVLFLKKMLLTIIPFANIVLCQSKC